MESTNVQSVENLLGYKPRLIFTDYGLGKFYIYRKDGQKHHIIEMNRNMYDFNRELFYWVLRHELKHNEFYQDPEKEGVQDLSSEAEQMRLNKINYRMKNKLFRFQLKHPMTIISHYMKWNRFAIKEDKSILNYPDRVCYHEVKPLPPEEEVKVRMYLDGL